MSAKENLISAIKGTHDILPLEALRWQKIEAISKQIFELYGYREIRTPVFEATQLFEKGTGETSDVVTKEMYTFIDKGGRSLTLRPEYTPSIVRAIMEHNLHLQPQPMRYYALGPMFRYDKPQKGRYRQFHQIDVEVFGEDDPAIDAEVVEMAETLLSRLNLKGIEIIVNSVGCTNCRPAYHKKIREKAEKLKDSFCADCRTKIAVNPLRIFDCKVPSCQEASQMLPEITAHLCSECETHFQAFCSHLNAYGLSYKIDPRLVRGLDYYTKTAFEIISKDIGAQDAILGGGRYDKMMKDFGGPDICGIGFAIGIERLLSLACFEESPHKFLYIVCLGEEAKKAGMLLGRDLRKQGMECLIEYKSRSIKTQMSRASKLNATWVLIVGDEEVKKQKFQLKDMQTGQQKELSRDELLKTFKDLP